MFVERIKEWFIRANQTPHEQRLAPRDLERINDMFSALAKSDPRARPSRYWEELNKMNLAQLNDHGYENFKRTIALNYFTWMRIFPWDSQIVFLCKNLPMETVSRAMRGALRVTRQSDFASFNVIQVFCYGLLTLLLWEYLLQISMPAEFLALREPKVGNPPLIHLRPGTEVSQDLGNSLLEYDSFRAAIPATGGGTVLELGGGYGRNAFVILQLNPDIKYVVVDIPPALWVAEQYLSGLFPGRRIFRYRSFDRFDEVAREYAESQIAFLLSSQLALLPPDSIDFVLNISSLHEMRKDQIGFYFELFDRILRVGGHTYIKEWKLAKVLFEGVTLEEKDYCVPPGWTQIMRRTARVQTNFFEALYMKISDQSFAEKERPTATSTSLPQQDDRFAQKASISAAGLSFHS